MLVAQVPDQVHGQRRGGHGRLNAGHVAQQVLAQQAGGCHQQWAVAQKSGHAAKARHGHGKAAAYALRGQQAV